MMKPLTLSTPRLILRRASEHDAELLYQNYCSNVDSSKFLTRLPHTDIRETRAFLNTWCTNSWDQEAHQFAWVIALATTNEAIGVFLVESDNDKAQIHYGISQSFEGKGFVTEAGRAVITWLKTQSQGANVQTTQKYHEILFEAFSIMLMSSP